MLRVNFNDSSSTYTDSVYQWDLNQVLEIAGLDLPVSPVIHFCNRNSTESLLVQSTTSEGVISCPVPNILLKEDLDIVAYIVSMEDQKATTLFKVLIPVNKRVKPSDYEYIDNVPILTYEAIEADIQTYFNKSKSYVDFATNRLATNFAKAIFIEKGTTVYGGGFELYSLGNLLLIKHIPGVLADVSTSNKTTLFEYGEQYPAVSEDEDRKLANGITLTLTTDRKVKYSTPDTITSGGYRVESGIDIFMTNAVVDPVFNPITTVVTELPTTNINSNTMYFLKKSDNTYEEYMFVDNKWLNIGGDYSDGNGVAY